MGGGATTPASGQGHGSTLRRAIVAALAAGLLALTACGSGHRPASQAAAPRLDTLPSVALAPADLAGAYKAQSEGYLNTDGQPVAGTTNQFRRVLALQPDAPAADAANVILITLNNSGSDQASDFIDSAQDDNTGPPNLEDYVASTVPGSSDVHATLVHDFPSEGDGSAANRLTWQQTVNGTTESVQAYGVYVQQGGMLAFVSVRATDTGGGEPAGLRKEAEDVVKKQAAKLKQGTVTQGPAGK